MGIVAKDSISLLITEATGLQRQETMLTANLLPPELRNFFWLSLAAALFCLIFIYLLLHTFHSFWGAAALSIIVFLFLLPIRGMIMSFIPFGADQLTATPYILNVFSRWQQANIGVLIFGLLLFCTSYWGDRYLLKKSA
jgi:hypothetical protein